VNHLTLASSSPTPSGSTKPIALPTNAVTLRSRRMDESLSKIVPHANLKTLRIEILLYVLIVVMSFFGRPLTYPTEDL